MFKISNGDLARVATKVVLNSNDHNINLDPHLSSLFKKPSGN